MKTAGNRAVKAAKATDTLRAPLLAGAGADAAADGEVLLLLLLPVLLSAFWLVDVAVEPMASPKGGKAAPLFSSCCRLGHLGPKKALRATETPFCTSSAEVFDPVHICRISMGEEIGS